MSKKFTKTILSSAVAGLLLVSGGAIAQENFTRGDFSIEFYNNGDIAKIVNKKDKNDEGIIANTVTGTITTVNKQEVENAINALYAAYPNIKEKATKDPKILQMVVQQAGEAARYSISLPPEFPSITGGNLQNITVADIKKIKSNVDAVSTVITSKTAADYNQAVSNGMSSEAALTVAKDGGGAVLKEFNRIDSKIVTDTTFAIDADGNITLDETAGTGERYGVKDVVADLVADTTVYAEEDGSLTMDNSAPARKRVNEALVDLDKSVRERTTVGVSSDGTLTRAEGAKNTISVNDGLVALSGRTDRIDAAVGAIDGRVTRNTQSIEKNSKAIAANTRTLQQHSARLDSQQRQINEN
ncbi:hypothetical protein, partial [Escherichia coli]